MSIIIDQHKDVKCKSEDLRAQFVDLNKRQAF